MVKKIRLQCMRPGFDPWVEKIPWKRKWQPTPVFLPGESHGQRSLMGYSPCGHKESDTTERLSTHCIIWKCDRSEISFLKRDVKMSTVVVSLALFLQKRLIT